MPVRIETYTDSDKPEAVDLGIHGKYLIENTFFETNEAAFDFILAAYKKDRGVLTAWHKPMFINTVASDFAGGSLNIGAGDTALDAYKLAVLVNKLIRNDKGAGRKLKQTELDTMKKQGYSFLKKKITYEDGLKERGRKVWQ